MSNAVEMALKYLPQRTREDLQLAVEYLNNNAKHPKIEGDIPEWGIGPVALDNDNYTLSPTLKFLGSPSQAQDKITYMKKLFLIPSASSFETEEGDTVLAVIGHSISQIAARQRTLKKFKFSQSNAA